MESYGVYFDNLLLTDGPLEDNIPALAKEDFYEIKNPKIKTVDPQIP
ncbi:MAG TPA: hypothetical protein VK076_01020 [Candidatus Sphingobacterium stercoripullorum]|nr:hypothetical protein [Candidatus Sphingobacterium stercoripullorum]